MKKSEGYVPPSPKRKPGKKLADQEVWVARRNYNNGESVAFLASHFKVSRPTMRAAIHGTGAYKDV